MNFSAGAGGAAARSWENTSQRSVPKPRSPSETLAPGRKGTPAALEDFGFVVTGLTVRVHEGWQHTVWVQRLGHPPPPRVAALVVGVLVSLFQALTQIQEQTLIYVPKILAVFIGLLIMLPFMGDALAAYMTRIAARIAAGG